MSTTYDYGRSMISKATGLTGIEAGHIANKLKEINVDPEVIDWEGAISDARDYGDRYAAVKRYIFDYYGVNIMQDTSRSAYASYDEQELEYLTSSKKGVKDILKSYYNSSSKKEKEKIKEMLLNDNQMQMVLMTALYDGAEMPLAKRFLNEAMSGSASPIKLQEPMQLVPITPEKAVVTTNGTTKKPETRKTWMQQLRETQTAQSIKKALPEAQREVEKSLKAISAQLKSSIDPKQEKATRLRGRIQYLKAQNEPLRLQLQYQRLLHQRQQLQQLKQLHAMQARPNPMNMMFAQMMGLPVQQPQMPIMNRPLEKPGHYIEFQPRLPPGYKWRKIPSASKKKRKKR